MPRATVKPKRFRDSDGDGLSDFDEINYFGSDPYNADSDGDGIEDGEAVLNGKDPVGGAPLKDFFIPHKGNNYQPKSLHPKRLLFHAGGALAAKIVLLIFVSFYPLSAWMTPDVSAEEGAKIIALTNTLRTKLALAPLKANSKLNLAAEDKVQDMFINQYFAHESPQNFNLEHFLKLATYQNYTVVGENLAMGFYNAPEVMTAWENSPTHYENLVDPNYTEIGVALAGGSYQKQDTVFVAQYFGLPQKQIVPVVPKTETKPKQPVIAKVVVNKPVGFKTEKVIKVEATLPADTKAASLAVLNNSISLAPTADPEKWSGQAVIQDNSKSVTPSVLTVSDVSGGTQKVEVANSNITPEKTSVASQYWLFKTHPTNGLAQIFDITSIYYKILLALVILSLLLNIFIKFRKQHPKLIFSGLGLVVFLIVMIVF